MQVWIYFHDVIIFVWWFGWYKILWRFFFPSKFSIIFWVPVFLLRSPTTFWILMVWCDLLLFSLVYFRMPSLFWVCWNFTIMCLSWIGLSLYTGPLCSENLYPSVLTTFLLRSLMQFPLLDFLHPFFWKLLWTGKWSPVDSYSKSAISLHCHIFIFFVTFIWVFLRFIFPEFYIYIEFLIYALL